MDNTTPMQIPGLNQQQELPPKSSGCGCFLIGCFVVLLLIAAPFIGGGIYLATLSAEDWGDGAIWVVKNQSFAQGFKNGITESDKLNDSEKQALNNLYDAFLQNYDKLLPDKQQIIKKDIVSLTKKLYKNQNDPTIQTEVSEIYQLLESANGGN